MNDVNLHRGNRGRPTVYRDYQNRSTRVAATGPIAATRVATAAATEPVGLPEWRGNSIIEAYRPENFRHSCGKSR